MGRVSSEIVDCLEHLNNNSFARNILTYDFSTLYTKLDHGDIKKALKFLYIIFFALYCVKTII